MIHNLFSPAGNICRLVLWKLEVLYTTFRSTEWVKHKNHRPKHSHYVDTHAHTHILSTVWEAVFKSATVISPHKILKKQQHITVCPPQCQQVHFLSCLLFWMILVEWIYKIHILAWFSENWCQRLTRVVTILEFSTRYQYLWKYLIPFLVPKGRFWPNPAKNRSNGGEVVGQKS